jgi:hypothetical protein
MKTHGIEKNLKAIFHVLTPALSTCSNNKALCVIVGWNGARKGPMGRSKNKPNAKSNQEMFSGEKFRAYFCGLLK